MGQRWADAIRQPNHGREAGREAMILEILFVVCMFLWFLAQLPVPQAVAYSWASTWLAFIAVLLLGLFIFLPALRG